MRASLFRGAVLAAALMVAVPTVQAQTTVDEIVARNTQAKGGAAVLKSTNTVRTTGKGTMQGAEVSITSDLALSAEPRECRVGKHPIEDHQALDRLGN